MDLDASLFGTDLRLLGDLEHQWSRAPGSDLRTVERPERGMPGEPPPRDLETVAGVENLQQALLLRFLTPLGDLAPLGHPRYGSRLFELIGELNGETSRNRAKLYVLQALAEEPRVAEVLSVSVGVHPAVREQIEIRVALVALREAAVLNLVFPFSLAAGATT
ncbi:MAG: GPW/gp25 family protein [Longimicrobiaceae bacterium]